MRIEVEGMVVESGSIWVQVDKGLGGWKDRA